MGCEVGKDKGWVRYRYERGYSSKGVDYDGVVILVGDGRGSVAWRLLIQAFTLDTPYSYVHNIPIPSSSSLHLND
jgi:hypothetical protein